MGSKIHLLQPRSQLYMSFFQVTLKNPVFVVCNSALYYTKATQKERNYVHAHAYHTQIYKINGLKELPQINAIDQF